MKKLYGWIKAAALGFAALSPSYVMGVAQAQSCSVVNNADLGINFGTYSGSTVSIPSSGTLKIRCNNPMDTARFVYLCVGLGAGSAQGSTVNDRRLRNGISTLKYQLYRDDTHQQVFGAITASSPIYSLFLPANTPNTNYDTGMTVYGQLAGNQTTGATGTYQSQFNSAHMTVKSSISSYIMKTNCSNLTNDMPNSGSFTVQTLVQPACSVTVPPPLRFLPTAAPPASSPTRTGRIQIHCEGGQTGYDIELQDGLYALNSGHPSATRRMRHATKTDQYIAYELYRNPQYTQRWGRIDNNQHVSGTTNNSGAAIHNVYARATVPSDAHAGDYVDTVAVVLEY